MWILYDWIQYPSETMKRSVCGQKCWFHYLLLKKLKTTQNLLSSTHYVRFRGLSFMFSPIFSWSWIPLRKKGFCASFNYPPESVLCAKAFCVIELSNELYRYLFVIQFFMHASRVISNSPTLIEFFCCLAVDSAHWPVVTLSQSNLSNFFLYRLLYHVWCGEIKRAMDTCCCYNVEIKYL